MPTKKEGLNYKEVALIIFTKPPKLPHTIRIRLEEMEMKHIFEVLFSIFLEGYRILFTIMKPMGTKELDMMNSYMKSIGFIVEKHHTKRDYSYCIYNYPVSKDTNPTITLTSVHDELPNSLPEYYIDMHDYQLNINQYVCC
jgi:hypothetical protein